MIAHLTSVHPRYDTRIFLKMCSSLATAGYDVSLVVADGLGDEVVNGISIVDAGLAHTSRFERMTKAVKEVFKIAVRLDADIYHLHDPELLPIGLKLKRLGKKVVFDSHEDLPSQLLSKPYLNKLGRVVLSKLFSSYERRVCQRFDGVIGATPCIRDKFLTINRNAIDINNFPLLDELLDCADWANKRMEVAYVGGIAEIRGVAEIVRALEYTPDLRLNLAGSFSEYDFEQVVKAMPGWANVNAFGFIDRSSVRNLLARSLAGLVTFHPLPNHVNAQPNKMFEYMSAGIPVIASNFPLWRQIIEGNRCGLLVDPLDPVQIADAISYLFKHPDEARRMGQNGRKAVIEHYNWPVEEKRMLAYYDGILRLKP